MLKAGLTGGVGAGKSRILSWMEKTWGAGIIRTDEVAHQLMEPGEKAYIRVTEELGTSFLDQEGRIDRPALARLIFQDGQAKKTIFCGCFQSGRRPLTAPQGSDASLHCGLMV